MKHTNVRNRQSQHYLRLLSIFRNAPALLPLIMVPVGLLVREGSLNSDFYRSDASMVAIIIAYAINSVIYFIFLKKRPENVPHLFFQIVFHILTMVFVLFVAGFLSAFLSVWILLMISADLLYGKRGFWMSLAALAITGVLTLLVRPETPLNERVEILQAIVVIGLIGYVIARFRGITDREREALAVSKDQESFERERLLALVNSMGDAVLTTDTGGIIKVYNAALLNLLDTNKSPSGRHIDEVLHIKDRSGRKIHVMELAGNVRQVFSRTDLTHTFSNGEAIRLYLNVAPIRPGYQGHVERGFTFILRDITKEKTLEEERDEFVSVVSHELRTPIAIAEGNLSNIKLLQKTNPEATMKAVDVAYEQVLYLARLINDLGTLARAERGLDTQVDIFSAPELINEVSQNYRAQAREKGLDYTVKTSSNLPDLKTSRLYLQEILQNFITNALKYTKKGAVTISAKKTDKGVMIAVSDTGIGISRSDQKHMFEKFYRAEDYRIRETSGTGLGLYVCKKLAEKAGMGIAFESQLEKGSTFSITIPNEQLVQSAVATPSK
ncbi:MAG TPA: ATP-binding protein [Candidatus Saccharimonadales bacterium]